MVLKNYLKYYFELWFPIVNLGLVLYTKFVNQIFTLKLAFKYESILSF